MKKYYLLAVTLAALVSCSSDDFVGNDSPTVENNTGEAIAFGFDVPTPTRAGDLLAADAATKLQNQFVVYGIKHASAEDGSATNDKVVFQNYVVNYTANTAGTQLSNTHNWEYVSQTPYAASIVSPAITGSQAIKYWDYSAAQGYTFYAIASKNDMSTTPNPLVTVSKTTTGTTVYDKGYSVAIKSGATLDNLFVSDRTPVAKTAYNKPVLLTFRNFGTRVRVGFYETIPGYTVTIDKFYIDADASTTAEPATAPVVSFEKMDVAKTNFAASLQNISLTPTTSNTLNVSYYDGDNGPLNQAKVTPSNDVDYNYSLELGSGVVGTPLATSSATPTWDKTDGLYTTVYPCSDVANPMLIKVDYTLTAEDGGGETIEVKGANVVVPTQYVQWKSNFAYTYLFKISDKTNGKTDPEGTLEGLYPITFDAAVVAVTDDKTQETISTFENYAVTTYANGSTVTSSNEYTTANDIYVVTTNNTTHAVVAPTAIGDDAATKAQVYKVTTSGDKISEATILAKLMGSPNGLTLTSFTASFASEVPAADGTNFNFGEKGAVKFTPDANGYYAYVYIITKYVAPTYESVGNADYSNTTTYYFCTTGGVYYAASGINSGNFATYKENLYTLKTAATPGEYAIKVIRVGNPG